MERKLFGTDGIRGKANVHPMTGEIAMALGRAVTAYFQSSEPNVKPKIVIGKDTRLSCYMLEQAFASGVCSQGGRAILTGPLPTPGVAFVTSSLRAQAGVMISASHNPYYDNGIKIFDSNGKKLPDEVEFELEKMILNPKLIKSKFNEELGNAKRLDEVIGRYIVFVKSSFDIQYSLKNMRVVVDCAHGASYKIAPMIFSEMGAQVMSLGVSPNGLNINEGCGALYPQYCAENVKLYRADIGICLDGDADRLVIVDEKGKKIEGDILLGILARFQKDKGSLKNNEVVGTVMSNKGLEVYLKSKGIKLARTKVGDRYISEYMEQTGSTFGGEPSGHIIFKDHSTTGDGILSALKVIEALKYYNKSLSELSEEIELYPNVLKNIVVDKKIPFEQLPKIMAKVAEAEKKLHGKGRVLLRYSGTENLARVMVEGKEISQVEKLCDDLVSVVKQELTK